MNMNTTLIGLFNKTVDVKSDLTFAEVNKVAMPQGFFVTPSACNGYVLAFLENRYTNHNSTFYKNWESLVNLSKEEILLDQMYSYFVHEFTGGRVCCVPNDGNGIIPDYTAEYTVISSCTEDEMYERCMDMLKSGIALKNDTMRALCDFVCSVDKPIDVDTIKNREAQTKICIKKGLHPHKKFDLLRFIVASTTGDTMIVQNSEMFKKIRTSEQFDFSTLSERDMIALSSIFLRYKNLFCAFKKIERQERIVYDDSYYHPTRYRAVTITSPNAKYINRLRKLAVKNHAPMTIGFGERALCEILSDAEIKKNVKELNSFKLVRLMECANERLMELDTRLYPIRNGRVFMKELDSSLSHSEILYYASLYEILEEELVSRLSEHATTVRYPKNCRITLPSTEKSFVGNYPFGTTYTMGKNNFIGIYWRNGWGTRDFDLSYMDVNGNKVGWNGSWNHNNAVMYSGDMRTAHPHANEVLFVRGEFPDGVVCVNRFDGENGSRYRLYFGSQDIVNLHSNYMVDPNCIAMQTDCVSTDSQDCVAIIENNEITLMKLMVGNDRVSRGNWYSKYVEYYNQKKKCFVDAKTILEKAGFTEYDEESEEECGIDLSEKVITRDTLISLMA